MNREIENLLFYKELIKRAKLEAFEDFNDFLDRLIKLDKKIEHRLQKLSKMAD